MEVELVAQYGVLGAAVISLAAFARQAYKREADRADRLEEELRALNTKLQQDLLPVVARAAIVLEKRTRDEAQ